MNQAKMKGAALGHGPTFIIARTRWKQRGRALRQRPDWKRRLNAALNHSNPQVFVGPIAAGEKVIASTKSPTATFLRASYGDTLAVEMEGRGFFEGVHINAPVEACVIRGISDLLSGKNKADKSGLQEIAADAASAAAFEILAGLYIGASGKHPRAPFQEMPSTITKAAFFQSGEVLARVGVPDVDEVLFAFSDSPDATPIPIAALNAAAPQAPLLKMPQYGAFNAINRYGAMAYDPGGSQGAGHAELAWATQLFPNGELWCVGKTVVVRERRGRPAWIPIPFIPAELGGFMFDFVRFVAKSFMRLSETTRPNIAGTPSLLAAIRGADWSPQV